MSSSISTWVTVEGRDFLCEEAGGCTWNVFPMFYKALNNAGISTEGKSISKEWDGKNAQEVLPEVEAIIQQMEAEPSIYRAMNPSNGWGSYESALEFMQAVRNAIVSSPKSAFLSVS